MKPLVFNSTPLIYLTKAGLTKVIEDLINEKMTSSIVKKEIVDEGKRKGVPDAIALENLFEKGVIKVSSPKDKTFVSRLMETRGLHIADAEVLALAQERMGTAVIDDGVARKTAKVYGIDYVGTPYVLMRATYERLISKDEAKSAIKEMITLGWRCSIESYVKIMEALESIRLNP